jgi:cell division protein FtsQ
MRSWRFRVRSANDIEVAGDAPNSRPQVLDKMHQVIGRNVFQISLAEQKQELEKIPWVEAATVIRLWPNRFRVIVKERTPVAFITLGDRIELIDAQGVLMEIPPAVQSDYSFPVILGMTDSEPLSTRTPRMNTFMRLERELDGGTRASGTQTKAQYSRNLDEVDLSDPEDVKVTAKGGSGPIVLHLGNEDFLPRFMVFLSNVQKWEQERGKLESVDLRYGRQVILNPDMHPAPPHPAPEAATEVAAPQNQASAKPSHNRHRPQKRRN